MAFADWRNPPWSSENHHFANESGFTRIRVVLTMAQPCGRWLVRSAPVRTCKHSCAEAGVPKPPAGLVAQIGPDGARARGWRQKRGGCSDPNR